MERRSDLADLIRIGREREHLSQEELAQRSGLSRNTIAALELSRIAVPSPAIVRALSRSLGIPNREFLQAAGYDVEGDGEALRLAEGRMLSHFERVIEDLRRQLRRREPEGNGLAE